MAKQTIDEKLRQANKEVDAEYVEPTKSLDDIDKQLQDLKTSIVSEGNTDLEREDRIVDGEEDIPLNEDASKDNTEEGTEESKTEEESKEEKEETTEESDKEGEKKSDKEEEETEETKEESEEEETKVESEKKVEEDKTKPKTIRIDSKFISQQPKELQEFYSGVKDEVMTEKALKNYINAQKYIAETKQQKQPVQEPPKKLPDEVKQVREQIVSQRLREKYPDMPDPVTETEAYKEWRSDLNYNDPDRSIEFNTDRRGLERSVDEQITQFSQIASDPIGNARKTIVEDVAKFEAELHKYGISSKDLGIDLDTSNEDYQSSYLYKEVVFNEEGNPDPRIVGNFYNVPVINKDSVYQKLWEKNKDAIFAAVTNAKLTLAKAPNGKKSPNAPPSLGGSKSVGLTPNKVLDTDEAEAMEYNPDSVASLAKHAQKVKERILKNT